MKSLLKIVSLLSMLAVLTIAVSLEAAQPKPVVQTPTPPVTPNQTGNKPVTPGSRFTKEENPHASIFAASSIQSAGSTSSNE